MRLSISYVLFFFFFFFFNDTATTEIYTLSLHDALPISPPRLKDHVRWEHHVLDRGHHTCGHIRSCGGDRIGATREDVRTRIINPHGVDAIIYDELHLAVGDGGAGRKRGSQRHHFDALATKHD